MDHTRKLLLLLESDPKAISLPLLGMYVCNIFLYSQTGCSFDGNFANFRRNIGILVDSLRRASCNRREQVAQFIWYLVTELVEIFQNVSSVTSIL